MAGKASQQNGKLGGRPKGSTANHTLMAQVARARLIEMYKEASEHINLALIKKALDGDILAIKELHDRVFGKAYQAGEIDVTSNGKPLELTDEQYKQIIAAAAKRGGGNESSA